MKPTPNAQKILCACGCGIEIWDRDSQYRKRRFIKAHGRIKPVFSKKCSCGCGETIKTKKTGDVFMHGHNWRNKSRGGMTLNEKLGDEVECACGCGEKITEYRVKADGRRYKVRYQVSHGVRGANNHLWKGGVTEINEEFRHSFEYRRWRIAVFRRDNYTCVICGARNKRGYGKTIVLNADHIKSYAEYPELRTVVENGRTLCLDCHKKTPNYAGKGLKRSRKLLTNDVSTDTVIL